MIEEFFAQKTGWIYTGIMTLPTREFNKGKF